MKKITFVSLVSVVIAIGFLHFFTPGHLIFYHDTYRRLSYFPIVLGAVLFGVRGGASLAVMSSVAFIPHLLLYIHREPAYYLSELTEIILYLAAGIVIGLIADKQARLRDQYRSLSQKLEKSYARLHEETALLIEVEEQLAASQKLSALGQLSASLAHEIKTPLSSIRGTAEILLDEFAQDHPKREFVEILVKEASRLNTTVEEVLQFSRNQPRKEIATEQLSLVISRVVKLLETQLRNKSVVCLVLENAEATGFMVDGDRLSQVFLNIVVNALDAVSPGGKIEIRFRKEAEGLSISVSDNGPGIAGTEKERVFEPFFSKKEGGTGLGLSISRKIVASYGGTLILSETGKKGACFTVFLPHSAQAILSSAGS